MRGFVLHRYEPNPIKFDSFCVFVRFCCFNIVKHVKKTWVANLHISQLFPKAPAPRPHGTPPKRCASKFPATSCPFFVSNFVVFWMSFLAGRICRRNHQRKFGKDHFVWGFIGKSGEREHRNLFVPHCFLNLLQKNKLFPPDAGIRSVLI